VVSSGSMPGAVVRANGRSGLNWRRAGELTGREYAFDQLPKHLGYSINNKKGLSPQKLVDY